MPERHKKRIRQPGEGTSCTDFKIMLLSVNTYREEDPQLNNRSEAQAKYDAKNTKRFGLKLNLKTDKDILDKLSRVSSVQGYIKKLIRKDISEELSEEE